MQLHIFKTPEEVISRLANHVVQVVTEAIAQRGACNISLSGGSSPKKLYELLASPAYRTKINWNKLYFFFGDERYVPFENPDYNGLMAKRSLFEPLQIDEAKIFYIDTSAGPATAAAQYEKRMVSHFCSERPVFDLVLLGLGDNAHTASLFPHTPVLHEEQKLVSEVYLEKEGAHRITLTAPVINHSRHIDFLVYGAGKAPAVAAVLDGEKNIEEFPAQLIQPAHGSIDWFLDEAAASQLKTAHH